jgi:hypothetical protein
LGDHLDLEFAFDSCPGHPTGTAGGLNGEEKQEKV